MTSAEHLKELTRERDAIEGLIATWRTREGSAFESVRELIIAHYEGALEEIRHLIEHLEEGGEI